MQTGDGEARSLFASPRLRSCGDKHPSAVAVLTVTFSPLKYTIHATHEERTCLHARQGGDPWQHWEVPSCPSPGDTTRPTHERGQLYHRKAMHVGDPRVGALALGETVSTTEQGGTLW